MKKVKVSLKRITARELIFIQIVYCAIIGWATPQFGLPGIFRYLTDAITAMLFVEMIFYEIKQPGRVRRTPIFYLIVLFFLYTLLGWLMNLYSGVFYLWGLRNNFRFYVFLIACTIFLEKEDIPKIFNILYIIFIANVIMCTYQYFILGKHGDYVAGFCGSTEASGGNGSMVMVLTLVCIITVVQYMEKHGGILKVGIAILGTLYIATIAEIKVLYLLIIAIIVLANLFTKFSIKKLFLTIVFIAVIPVAIELLYKLYPGFENFFEYERIMKYASGQQGYTGKDDINRLTAINYCMEHFLKTPIERMFGIGLGNADGSTNVLSVISEFYKKNIDTHYTWFSVPFMFIETGFVGLLMFLGVFFISFKDSTKLRKTRGINREYVIIGQLIAVFSVIIAFVNGNLRTETMGYTYYMMLSIPYLLTKEGSRNNRN